MRSAYFLLIAFIFFFISPLVFYTGGNRKGKRGQEEKERQNKRKTILQERAWITFSSPEELHGRESCCSLIECSHLRKHIYPFSTWTSDTLLLGAENGRGKKDLMTGSIKMWARAPPTWLFTAATRRKERERGRKGKKAKGREGERLRGREKGRGGLG